MLGNKAAAEVLPRLQLQGLPPGLPEVIPARLLLQTLIMPSLKCGQQQDWTQGLVLGQAQITLGMNKMLYKSSC